MALEEYQELKSRHDFLTEQQNDLQQALDALRKTIAGSIEPQPSGF